MQWWEKWSQFTHNYIKGRCTNSRYLTTPAVHISNMAIVHTSFCPTLLSLLYSPQHGERMQNFLFTSYDLLLSAVEKHLLSPHLPSPTERQKICKTMADNLQRYAYVYTYLGSGVNRKRDPQKWKHPIYMKNPNMLQHRITFKIISTKWIG